MKTILISGCSYCEIFSLINLQNYVKEKFRVDRIVNISKQGSSIFRQIKAVIEWISFFGPPDLVLLPLSHITRYDESIGLKYDVWNAFDETLCASMDPLKNNEEMNTRFNSRIDVEQINQLIKLKTLVYNEDSSFNNMLTQIITFSGWLKNENINHIIFDMCNNFNKKNYSSIKKRKFLSKNKNIIDIFKFCGNDFMYQNLTPEQHVEEKIDYLGKNAHHYGLEPNKKLIDYLKSYIMNNKL
jgi:hypothetical protein